MGEFISAGGAIIGGTIDVMGGGNFFGEGFQAGGLIGGLVGGGYAAGKAAFAKAGGKVAGWAAARAGFSAGAKTFGVEGTGAAIGFGYGMLSTGGDFQTSLMYANWGQMAPNAAKALARGGTGLYRKFRAPSGATRELRLPKTDASLTGTNTRGYTTVNGDIFLQPGLSRAQQAATLRHEGVHSFLSVADDAPLAGLRQRVGIGAYNNSAFFNATEEIFAESIASGSLRQGIRHAFNGAYTVRGGTVVTPLNFGFELGVGATGLGAFGYGAYEFRDWILGGNE
ncbi:MAG TPA: hypothetical protein VMY42_00435 [Thermoguttaceae bacterium]|nr:hypothetical protein [Thermoguttaceae bacterium]